MLELRDYFISLYGVVIGVYFWNIVFDYWYTDDISLIKIFNPLKFV